MKIKICGLKDFDNIQDLVKLDPDYLGFIFYKGSPRYAGDIIKKDTLATVKGNAKKVGVFVNENAKIVIDMYFKLGLDYIQLHGDENIEYVENLYRKGVSVIKVFNISEVFDFATTVEFDSYCDYYLFDTSGNQRGGTGRKFEWKQLDNYKSEKPFFLSGGIGPGDYDLIRKIDNKALYAIDLNSKFEEYPGMKEVKKLGLFIEKFREY